jgi:hypothetical protein
VRFDENGKRLTDKELYDADFEDRRPLPSRLRADEFPATENTVIPITVGVDRRWPGCGECWHARNMMVHPHAPDGSTKPVRLGLSAGTQKRRQEKQTC